MFEIKNERATQYQNLGRNGFFNAGGMTVSVIQWSDHRPELHLEPLTGKGNIGPARIVLCAEQIPALIEALESAASIASGMRSPPIRTYNGEMWAEKAGNTYEIVHRPGTSEDEDILLNADETDHLRFPSMEAAVNYIHESVRQEHQRRGQELAQRLAQVEG